MNPVYLDHNATTPLSVRAFQAMEPYLHGQFGNPMTSHRFGAAPRAAVDEARRDVASLLGADADDGSCRVIFDSGGSEALNHALKGIAFRRLVDGRPEGAARIVIGGIEHPAVDQAARWLAERFGFEVVAVAPDGNGVVAADAFLATVQEAPTCVASLHWANNELGTLQPVREVGTRCRELGVPFVCDGVQVVGKVPMDGALEFADAVAMSAHKFYGPKGVGALVVRADLELDPLVHGAAQESGQRAGTHNAAGIVAMGAAARAATADREKEGERIERMRDQLWSLIAAAIPDAVWNGEGAEVLPNTLNVTLPGCPSHLVCEAMDERGFAISGGAACRDGDVRPSRNLLATGASEHTARCSVRLSLGHRNSTRDVQAAADALAAVVSDLRDRL